MCVGQACQGLCGVGDALDLQTFAAKDSGGQRGDIGVILDQQQAAGLA